MKLGKQCSSFILVSSLVALIAPPAHADNYVLGVASCPPWKNGDDIEANERLLNMCPRDIAQMVNALEQRFDVKEENVVTLMQEDATPENMYRALFELEKSMTAGDTLFFFQMTHGGIIPYNYKGYNVSGEIFAYYSEEKPENFGTAVQDGYWISARDLRDAIYELGNSTDANIVAIVEACHSEAAGHEIVHNPLLNLDGNDRVSFIFSADADQAATFNDDSTGARFTEEFVSALVSADTGTSLDAVFSVAREKTHRGALNACMSRDPEDLKDLHGHPQAYFENCTQEPAFVDPRGLMLDLKVN